MSCLLPGPSLASEDPLCDSLLLLDRLPGHARGLLAPRPPASARFAYLADIERTSIRFGQGASVAIPTEVAAAAGQAVALHRRFLKLIDAKDVASGSYLMVSRDWRRITAFVDDQLRHRDCAGMLASMRPDAVPTTLTPPAVPAGIYPSSPSQPEAAERRAQVPELPTGGLLALLSTITGVLAGAILSMRRRERRKSPRVNCFITGAMQGHLYCEATDILDISRTGCKVRLHDWLDPEQPLTLFFGNWTIRARAIWSNSHYAGLMFDKGLTASQLRDILEQAGRRRDRDGPPVPALPCHDGTCRALCPKYQFMQQEKAAMRKSGVGPIDTAT